MTEDTIENLNCEILIQPNKLIKLVPKLVLVILMVAGLKKKSATFILLLRKNKDSAKKRIVKSLFAY
jgi:hypothetical protein